MRAPETEFFDYDNVALMDEIARCSTIFDPMTKSAHLPAYFSKPALHEPHLKRVLDLAMYTFGDLRIAEEWMRERNVRLRTSPTEACTQDGGVERVIQLLYAIGDGTEP